MKTAKEVLDEYGCPSIPFDECVTMNYDAIIEAMKEYAKAALEDAAENAKVISGGTSSSYSDSRVDKESITNIELN